MPAGSTIADRLAGSEAERSALAELRAAAGEADGVMERHTVRCFLLMELLARRRGAELDREVALTAAFLHDIGLYESITEGGVYTEEGAELARRIGTEAGWSPERADLCAEACARHHSLRSQWQLGAEVETLRLADRVEVSGGLLRGGLTRGEVVEVNERAPRDGFYGGLARLVWPMLRSRPRTLPSVFRARRLDRRR